MSMEGLGCLVWLLGELPAAEVFAAFCQYYRIRRVAFKMLDGLAPVNWDVGEVKRIVGYFQALKAVGTDVGMWQYTEGLKPGPEGAAVGAVFEKFEQYGLSFFYADAEAGDWNKYGSKGRMELYLNSLGLPKRIPVYLCSYRFPTYFPQFPFPAAMRHELVAGKVAPQVYPEFSHDFGAQVTRSLKEYEVVAGAGTLTEFVPVLPTYYRGTPGDPNGWGPTVKDLQEAVATCQALEIKALDFYRAEKVFAHWGATKYTSGKDWMYALTGKPAFEMPGPPEPPGPPPPAPTYKFMEVVAPRVEIMVKAGPGNSRGHLTKGMRPVVIGNLVLAADKSVWARIGISGMWAMVKDKKGNQLMRWVS